MKTHIDCISSRQMIKLHGFIDTHVHVREPGASHKEDYASCTAAALAGGITMICAMPNTNPAVVDRETLEFVEKIAKEKARCDYALYVGASSDNANVIPELAPQVAALKMYLNETYTTLKLNDLTIWSKHIQNWPKKAPLCVHAESQTTAAILLLATLHNRPIHICHVARKEEIQIIKAAKEKGLKVTCEVSPHHLFLSTDNVPDIGVNKSNVRPVLCSSEDQKALWDNLHIIDCFATDHAPHTIEEKTGNNPPPGFPGLETILPLLLNAVNQGRLTIKDIEDKFHWNPKRIFNLPDQPNTYVEVDMDEEWIIPEAMRYSKAKWTPFTGMKIRGAVHRVVLRGEIAYVDGQVLVPPGYGQNVREWKKTGVIENRPLSPGFMLLQNGYKDDNNKEDWINDGKTNEIFSKLLEPSKQSLVHFAPDIPDIRISSVSPVPFTSNMKYKSDSNPNLSHSDVTHISSTPNHGLVNKHILTVDMFTKEQLNDIFNLAQTFRVYVSKDRPLDHILRGKVMASIFYEVSTRTSCSFSAAMLRLGGRVIHMDETSSSVKKGETLEDSVSVMAGYADVVVLRHPVPGSVLKASHHCRKPMVNAGDGVGEHPTQALLDVFTIREEIGTVNGLTITLVGDLKNGRTVHSLARLLTLYNVQLRYVSPSNLRMPKHIVNYVASKGINQEEFSSLESVLPDTDVLYMTRIQRERFETQEEYDQVCLMSL